MSSQNSRLHAAQINLWSCESSSEIVAVLIIVLDGFIGCHLSTVIASGVVWISVDKTQSQNFALAERVNDDLCCPQLGILSPPNPLMLLTELPAIVLRLHCPRPSMRTIDYVSPEYRLSGNVVEERSERLPQSPVRKTARPLHRDRVACLTWNLSRHSQPAVGVASCPGSAT